MQKLKSEQDDSEKDKKNKITHCYWRLENPTLDFKDGKHQKRKENPSKQKREKEKLQKHSCFLATASKTQLSRVKAQKKGKGKGKAASWYKFLT